MNPDQTSPSVAPVTSPASAAAVPAVPPSPAVAVSAPVAPRHSRAKTVAASVAVLVLALGAITYAWAYRGASVTLPEAARLLADAPSAHFALSLGLDLAIPGSPSFAGTVDIDGTVDRSDAQNVKGQMNFGSEFDGLALAFETRFLDDTLYVRATKVPGAAISDDPSLAALVGQWFFVSLDEIETFTGQAIDSGAAADEADEAADPAANFRRLADSGALAFGPASLVKFNGEYVREYDASLDSAKFADFAVSEMRRLATTTEIEAQVDQLEPTVRGLFPAVSLADGKVRVALFSGELRSAEGRVTVDLAKIDQAALAAASGADAPADSAAGLVNVKFAATYGAYGEPITVEVPTPANSLMNYLNGGEDPSAYVEGNVIEVQQ